jgi:indolepyruvate ferredoxin oxidoreductase alpha subunit
MHMAGEYNVESLVRGLSKFLAQHAPHLNTSRGADWLDGIGKTRESAGNLLGALPVRPPTFCVGCPERPVFSAMKLVAQDVGRPHVSMDVGCHAFASFEPFSQGNTLLGYGMSLAAAAGVGPMSSQRAVAVMGDGGFWHNGLLSGVASNLLNEGRRRAGDHEERLCLGHRTQELHLLAALRGAPHRSGRQSSCTPTARSKTRCTGLGVKWLRTVNNYKVGEVAKVYKDAMTSKEKGLKVIVAEGECQLERQAPA